MNKIQKPQEGEYAPYAIKYIDLLPNDDLVLEHLKDNLKSTQDFICSFSPEKLTYRWAEGEWTIKEILVHIIDTERIFCHRALRFGRNDPTELSEFEQDEYVQYSGANEQKIEEILKDYAAVRHSTLTLFNGFEEKALLRFGIVNGNRMSVRAAVFQIAGHELHHINSIKKNYS